MNDASFVAVDFGATSGRVVVGHVGQGRVAMEVVRRFPNRPVQQGDGLHWDTNFLFRQAIDAIASAVRGDPTIRSVGVDSWAVDYGLLTGDRLLAQPFHYRDQRTAAGVEAVHATIAPDVLYTRNGLQFLAFNTLYQLVLDPFVVMADTALLIPDLLIHRLCGARVAEATNASTTGLFDATTRHWDDDLIGLLGLPRELFAPLVEPGTTVGRTGAFGDGPPLDVVTVASHDTASAVVAVPMDAATSAYISCGTWGLVGVELEAPVLTEASRQANFTNELGLDGTVRYLHNVMGTWLLDESIRTWEAAGEQIDLPALLAAAAAVHTDVARFDPNDASLLPPGDMPARIAALCAEHDQPVPATRAELVRSILASVAGAFADAVETAASLSGRDIETIHLVGGGANNRVLCQLTANAAGRPVIAGPVEATALGNVLVQARAAGVLAGSLDSLRAVVAASSNLTTFSPEV